MAIASLIIGIVAALVAAIGWLLALAGVFVGDALGALIALITFAVPATIAAIVGLVLGGIARHRNNADKDGGMGHCLKCLAPCALGYRSGLYACVLPA